jgi:hypothetical protein
MTKQPRPVMEVFLEDLDQPALRSALYRSFRKWADLRDQLIEIYVEKTGIPEEEFHTAIARDLKRRLYG